MNYRDVLCWVDNYPIDKNHVCTCEVKDNGMYVRFGLVNLVEFTLLIKPNGMIDGHRIKGISGQSSKFANELIDYIDSL